MKFFILLLIFLTQSALALEAVVIVLETPLLREPNLDAQVVQYLRKGDIYKVDPALARNESFDHLAPTEEKLKALQGELEQTPEWKEDVVFGKRPRVVKDEDEFIAVLDRQGKTAYVIREHFYIYYENKKELSQVALRKDPTDYRLEEPLPKNYPLYSPTGYRGQVTLGFTQPYNESYPYNSDVKQKGYMSPVDLNIALLKVTPDDKYDRFYFGGGMNFKFFSNTYSLLDGRRTTEQGVRLGVGPHITYDAHKGEKNRINLYGSINLNLFNQLLIKQAGAGDRSDERIYRTYSLSPRIGAQYHRKQIMEDVDFVIGTGIEVEPATTFRAKNAATQIDWWRRGGSDKFRTRTIFTMAAYLGFQSAY